MKITIFSPSGVILERNRLELAVKRLTQLGASVRVDEAAAFSYLRFAGTDEQRLGAIHRAAQDDSKVALASRGGYGLTRLLDKIDWTLVGESVRQGKYWVGHSDFTVFNLALLKHTGLPSWAGPMALFDFGRLDAAVVRVPALDKLTCDTFMQAMQGQLDYVSFSAQTDYEGLAVEGRLWGGNLVMLCSMLATPHWPDIKDGILFIEEVNEHAYYIERMLHQLHQAGVLQQQKAILIGDLGSVKPTAVDRDYRVKDAIDSIRAVCDVPIMTGLPFGHVYKKLTLPVGVSAKLYVKDGEVIIFWGLNGFELAVQTGGLAQNENNGADKFFQRKPTL